MSHIRFNNKVIIILILIHVIFRGGICLGKAHFLTFDDFVNFYYFYWNYINIIAQHNKLERKIIVD